MVVKECFSTTNQHQLLPGESLSWYLAKNISILILMTRDPCLVIFKSDGISSHRPLEWPMLSIIHLVEPVARATKPSLIVDHAQGHITVVDIQVERHTPHYDES